jgi:hypothetical protein
VITSGQALPLLHYYVQQASDVAALDLVAGTIGSLSENLANAPAALDSEALFAQKVESFAKTSPLPTNLINQAHQISLRLATVPGLLQAPAQQRMASGNITKNK